MRCAHLISQAVEYFQRVLSIEEENGEIWSALGHCYLMQDDLQKAYSAYQQALYLLPNPKVRFYCEGVPDSNSLRSHLCRRTPNFGTGLAYFMTAMARSTTPRRRLHPCYVWIKVGRDCCISRLNTF